VSEAHDPPKKNRHDFRVEIKRHDMHEDGDGNWLVSYADLMTLLVGFFLILQSFSTIDPEKFEQIKRATTMIFGGEYQVPYSELADTLQKEINKAGYGDQVVIKQTDAGVDISFRGALFFDLGSADLKPEALTVLGKIIPVLFTQAKDFHFLIEGHTDDIPIASGIFRNNWELSSMRACRVLGMFEDRGFSRERLKAVGFADTRPVVPNRDSNGAAIPTNQSQNRRVVIKVLKKDEAMAN
jgi:chemotaxis protein MotB